ncbi:MAG TPA: TetR/AcrR family transcriptional regulator [Acidimicrobiales bacterium]|nr:TetR/AcrR family transcriptional regulator [Acidimicrobiales bacterium]
MVITPAEGMHEDGAPGRRAAHVQDTRRALLDTARKLFAEHGFHGTRTEEVVQGAGLTRGALYHHFRDKEDLFRAVFEEVEAEVDQLLTRRSTDRPTDSWALFRANSEVYLDAASTNQAYRQVVLIDGPAVLGQKHWSERGEGPTGKIADYLREAVDEGVLDRQPVEPLAHLLAALGVGSAMYVTHADDPVAARQEISACYERFLSGLGVHETASDKPSRPKAHETSTKGHS